MSGAASPSYRPALAESRKVLIAAAMAHFLNDGNSVTFAVLIIYYTAIGVSIAYLGMVASIYLLISGLVSERIGYFADKSGKRGLIMSVGILFLGVSILAFAFSFYLPNHMGVFILAGALFLGLGLAIYHPLGGAIITHAAKDVNPARQMGINGSFGSLGRAVFPTIIVFLISTFGIFYGLLTFSILTLVLSLLIFTLSKSFDLNVVKYNRMNPRRRISLLPYRRFIITLTLVFFLNAVFTQGIATFIPKYFETTYSSKQIAGIATSLTYLTPVAGQVILGTLTDRWGGRRILYLTTVMSVAVFTLFFLIKNPVAQVAILGLFAFFVYSGFPVVLGYAQQTVPKEVAARLNGIVWGLGNTLGGAAGASMAGQLVDHFSFVTSFYISWFFGLISIAFLPLVPKDKNSQAKMEAVN